MSAVLQKIQIKTGDITTIQVDAIVNAANSRLLGGGGVDGAIHRKAGPELLKECRALEKCPAGQARITKGYNLPAKWVIHAVGPIWRGGNENEPLLLASAYRSSLELAKEVGATTVAFPAISTGAYSYPKEQAARIAMRTVVEYLEQNPVFEQIIFICFTDEAARVHRIVLDELAVNTLLAKSAGIFT